MTKRGKILFFLSIPVFVALLYVTDIHCVWRALFGVPCLGCGMSRAYACLLRLDFVCAFRNHFMFWSVPILFLYVWFDGKLFRNKIADRAVLLTIGTGFLIRWALWWI